LISASFALICAVFRASCALILVHHLNQTIMKKQFLFNITAGLGLTLSLGLVSFINVQSAGTPARYNYDSVKLTSTYHFDHPAPAAKEAFARVVYPVLTDKQLNDFIKSAVLSTLTVKYDFQNSFAALHPALSDISAINNGAADYQELARNFLQQFEAHAPQEDLQAYWYADIQVKVITDQPDYTVVTCEKDFFTGGAHDLYDHLYLNYDKRNHRMVTLDSQLKPNAQNQLKAIAERIFRKNEGLNPTAELDGYFFKDEQFALPADFTITDKGVSFYYQYNEIKPFAAGTTQLLVPFAELKNLVQPGSVLAGQMKGH
jgi:hypothetical protein